MSNEMHENVGETDAIEPVAKRFKSSIISQHVGSMEFQKIFSNHWHGSKPVKTDRIEIITEPYRICKISDVLAENTFISKLKDELKDVESCRKNMDLYQFEQTKDLANVKSESIVQLYRTFESDLTDWMRNNTKIDLSGKISISSARYSDTDYLLCHDDNMGDRRIAFILYLSENWTAQDGGSLDIFDTDENGQPNCIVRSLIPEYNSLIFFEVSDKSYHQVSEVVSTDKVRISINGWFHGPLLESEIQHRPEITYKYFKPDETEVDLLSYISKIYLYTTIVKKIQRTIEKDSFIYLPNFLLENMYEKLCDDVKNENIKWEKTTPADVQNYEIANEDTLPTVLKNFYNIFKSIHIFHLLKQYTELDLVPEADHMKPRMKIELQRWSRGCYMLINDKEVIQPYSKKDAETENNENHKTDEIDRSLKAELKDGSSIAGKIEDTSNESKSAKSDDQPNFSTKHDINTIDEEILIVDKETATQDRIVVKNPHGKTQNSIGSKSSKGKEKLPISRTASSANCTKSVGKASMSVAFHQSDSTDTEDYSSNPPSDPESDTSQSDNEEKDNRPGTLDVLLQFHTENATDDTTIDYIDPKQKDGALIHIPPQDNHLCLVYRTADTCRCNEYVNHYCKGYFYTLVCSYYE
ncbi:prolyl 3-hydroxylase OGFOD1 [Neodiprion lecontei]|uniref:uS12 prolyl 3-hydroxylase n=1 Tax=Neodiprion lecontei TaxID=441921 RepID=A0A6J0C5V8_NEOLC|nr:prolyl 3-hydroxylase OGFOD1 [Neodiprion lecontei]